MPNITDYHIPVLLEESVSGLAIQPNGIYVDVTFGGGGHSKAIVQGLTGGRLYGFDQDKDAEANIDKSIFSDDKFTFVRSNFRYLDNWMRYYEVEAIDGLIADLGVSSHHFDDSTRGFSFREDAPLDMRMNDRAGVTAKDIISTYTEEQLADIFYYYGELKQARKIARTICKARSEKPIITTGELAMLVESHFGREREKKDLARLFQALRIEVNHEMEALKDMLEAATKWLKPHGRLVVITYHSLEDRIVKNYIKTGNAEGVAKEDFFGRREISYRQVNSKVIVPSNDELQRNPRSRSAKLRIAEKI